MRIKFLKKEYFAILSGCVAHTNVLIRKISMGTGLGMLWKLIIIIKCNPTVSKEKGKRRPLNEKYFTNPDTDFIINSSEK